MEWPVDVWSISLLRARPAILSEDEELRANRLRFEDDRLRWTRARSAMRTILAGYTRQAPESLIFVCGAHGKPALSHSEVEFNLSHAGDWALIAVARSVPVGIDIERMRENVDIAALLLRIGETDLPEGLARLYQTWTRREARSKAAGGALFDPPPREACAVDLEAPEGYAASVAMVGFSPTPIYRSEAP